MRDCNGVSDNEKLLVEILRKGLQTDGCLDGYCDINGEATGMHTNGGCHCLREVRPLGLKHAIQLALRDARKEAKR